MKLQLGKIKYLAYIQLVSVAANTGNGGGAASVDDVNNEN